MGGGGGENRGRARRNYRPTVEGLEALRMLSAAAAAHVLPGMVAARGLLSDASGAPAIPGQDAPLPSVSNEAWDAALGNTRFTDFLTGPGPSATVADRPTAANADPAAVASGLSQLDRYLNRAWYRAGIPTQLHDDSSQAVYATLLQNLGRSRFDTLVADVGTSGIREVFTRETSEGLAFFRAVDMVKKRAQREKLHQSLDSVDVASPSSEAGGRAALRAALQDAITHALNPREAALIHDTLQGKTPAEIALQWGVAPKTVSNEKSRVLQKLREALIDHELN
ncbi:MAG: LuxR C-terminal-related transcriptional regulator [Isosphaeraceae bacterium]